jgi:glycerol-3-phosphate dehydrogenase
VAVSTRYDVVVIGAGVVGAAIAKELSAYEVAVALVDGAPDVGMGTSKANTAILHTGFDATPGTLEARLVPRGYARLVAYAAEVGIPLEKTGALLVAWNDEQVAALPGIRDKAAKNGVTDVEALDAAKLYALEPHLGPGALAGLKIPGEGIVCPFTPPLAFATEAVANSVELRLGKAVSKITPGASTHVVEAGDARFEARYVINAAGLHSDEIDAHFGHRRFTVKPRRGELIVFDKLASGLITHVLLPVPTKTTKGVLVAPTVFGNVLLGPTAEEREDRADVSTSEAGLASLIEKGRKIMPALLDEEVTATYAGLRAATEHSDYQLHVDAAQRYVCVGGIRSTGLTGSLGIAEYVVQQIGAAGLALAKKASRRAIKMPYIGRIAPRPHEDAARIAANPDYGRIVCHCERVSLGELRDALAAPVPARSLDGLRRRTRCLQGRCQGFHCSARITALLEGAHE